MEEEDELSTSAPGANPLTAPRQNACRPESRTLRANPWKSLAGASNFSTVSEGFSISIFPASKTIYIYICQTPRHEVYKFESGSRATSPKHGVQTIHFQRGQNWGSLLHPPSLLPDPQLSPSWEPKGMWGRGQAGSWATTLTQVGLDPKVVPTLLGKGWRLPHALGQPVIAEGDKGPCTPSRLIRQCAWRPAEVLVDWLRSHLERDIQRGPSTPHPTPPPTPSTALSRSGFMLTTGRMSDSEAHR